MKFVFQKRFTKTVAIFTEACTIHLNHFRALKAYLQPFQTSMMEPFI